MSFSPSSPVPGKVADCRLTAGFRLLTTSLLCVSLAAGCGLSSGGGSSMMGRSWSAGSTDPVPGVTQGEVEVVTLYGFDQTEQTAVFWADNTDVLSESTSSSGIDGNLFEVNVKTATGIIKARMVLSEDDPGSVTIGDQTYPLTAGCVFLLKASGDQLEVAQVDVDVDWETIADYQSLATSTPAIADFFGVESIEGPTDTSAAASGSAAGDSNKQGD